MTKKGRADYRRWQASIRVAKAQRRANNANLRRAARTMERTAAILNDCTKMLLAWNRKRGKVA